MKAHQQAHKHQRYYVARHLPGDDLAREYAGDSRRWTSDFHNAKLYATHVGAVRKAKMINEFKSDMREKNYNVVIGRVDVAVDGYFPMEVIA